jgi:hypothetical protein
MCVHITYYARTKLDCVPDVWNSITFTDINKLCASSTSLRPSLNCFYPQVHYRYSPALMQLQTHTSRKQKHHFDALLLIQVALCSKSCPSLRKLQVIVFMLGTSDTALSRTILPLLYALQLLMFARTLKYLKPKVFLLITFLWSFLHIKMFTV